MKILLLDPNWPQSGYLIVSLRKAGFDVVRFATDALDHIGMGHYCRQIPAPGFDDDALLQNVLREERADFILPLHEDVQTRLWTYPEELTRNVIPRTTPLQRDALLDRRVMYSIVERAGVPVPSAMDIEGEHGLQQAADRFGYPFVLRGTQGLGGNQVRIIENLESAQTAYSYLRDVSEGPPFAQAFVAGRRCLIGGLFENGKMLRWFSQTTLESYSPPTGPSIRVKSVRDPRLTLYAERLFGALNWSGLACAEFIADENGDYSFLEVNARPWAAIHAAHVCGVPLFDMLASHLLGKELPPQADFPADKEVPLFPQYVSSKLLSRDFRFLRDGKAVIKGLAHAPWNYPFLMFFYFRWMWWGRGA